MLWALLFALTLADPAVTGIVKDSTGGAVSGATVIMRSAGAEQRTVTGPDGSFSFPSSPEGQVTLIVRAGGFAEATQTVSGFAEHRGRAGPAEDGRGRERDADARGAAAG